MRSLRGRSVISRAHCRPALRQHGSATRRSGRTRARCVLPATRLRARHSHVLHRTPTHVGNDVVERVGVNEHLYL